jgi:hypothetical protein
VGHLVDILLSIVDVFVIEALEVGLESLSVHVVLGLEPSNPHRRDGFELPGEKCP